MATLALGALGAAAGSALLPAGLSVLGTTLTGAAIGAQLGAMAGSYVDNVLFGASGSGRALEGPRLTDLHVTTSTEGAAIPRLYGQARLGGQVIWATRLEEEIVTSRTGGGGKGMRSGGGVSETSYVYYANFAVGLCQGEIAAVGRVWADGREIALDDYTARLYHGTEGQMPDSLIVAKEGADRAPAYRGLAYVVFERFPLAAFGNRIPQLSFEVLRTLDDTSKRIRGVVMIPGSGEFTYEPTEIQERVGAITTRPVNTHTHQGGSDWSVALEQMKAELPNASSVSLVVSWFGTSLDAAQCDLKPAVDRADKVTSPRAWSVAGVTRANAHVVSSIEGRPAYGGTPDDASVQAAIADLKARGHSVVLTPFVLMDIPSNNTLTDPYSAASSQAAYPWRGRITVSPAPGRPGSPDKSAAAVAALQHFIGTASPSHFSISGSTVTYSGPNEWSFRRMVLHYAHLAKAAGGVDAFVIGSELRGLTQIRGAGNSYPFVAALVQLAADVRNVLGATTKVLYAADWSEYFGHQPNDGSGDVFFHLDPLWSSPHIDAIGIDCYWPLADWRDTADHLDRAAGHRAITDLGYLRSNVRGGEGYDWYYASAADRETQVRTPITDGAGKPWVFRYKDLKSWWLNAHYNRPGGIESPSATAWVPQSKPVWFMEVGCPAVDKGANQPNVFVDAKSAESSLPYFSTGARDDTIQRRYIEAFLDAFDPARPGTSAADNPSSTVYGAPMVDLSRLHIYAWDARPTPVFPGATDLWGDAPNWARGHWISGRMAAADLAGVVIDIAEDAGFTALDASTLHGVVPGFVIDRVMSVRDALKPLELAYFFDALESGGQIRFRHRADGTPVLTVAQADLVETAAERPLLRLTRGQETELPATVKVAHIEAGGDYVQRIAEAQRSTVTSDRVAQASLPLVLDVMQAQQIAATWLHETWSARDRAQFLLPPSTAQIECGDVITLRHGGQDVNYRVTAIGDRGAREIEARRIDTHVYDATIFPDRSPVITTPDAIGAPLAFVLDLPVIDAALQPALHVAATQAPWPGAVAVWRSATTSGFKVETLLPAPATSGTIVAQNGSSHPWRLDAFSTIDIELDRGTLSSITTEALLDGGNLAVFIASSGAVEVFQFKSSTLIAPKRYRLSGLFRGQRGTEAIATVIAPGDRFLLLDDAVRAVPLAIDDLYRAANFKMGPASRDIGAPGFTDLTVTPEGRGLKPLSPVHVRGSRTPSGDITLTWIRRTRTSGDNWDVAEVPLSEDAERYVVDVLSGTTVKRSITTSTPSALYTAAEQVADFGVLQSQVPVLVAQISAIVGRGASASAVI